MTSSAASRERSHPQMLLFTVLCLLISLPVLRGQDVWGSNLGEFSFDTPQLPIDTFTHPSATEPSSSLGLGHDVQDIGDLNGDNLPDFAIAEPSMNTVYIFWGKSGWNAANAWADIDAFTTAVGVKLTGTDGYGYALSGGCDINGDKIDDLLISKTHAAMVDNAVQILFGRTDWPSTLTSSNIALDNYGAQITPSESSWSETFGSTVKCIKDFNKDGFDDILIGDPASGKTAIVKGGSWTTELGAIGLKTTSPTWGTLLTGTLGAVGVTGGLGSSLASGDFNNDGYEDVAISEISDSSAAGNVYILWGHSGAMTPKITLPVTDFTVGFTITASGYTQLGLDLTAAKISADSFVDLVLSTSSPAVLIYPDIHTLTATSSSLSNNKLTLSSSTPNLVTFSGNGGSDSYGTSLATGDFNGDSTIDVIIGGPAANSVGRVYVWLTQQTLTSVSIADGAVPNGISWTRFTSPVSGQLGFSVAALPTPSGPVNLLLGAPTADTHGKVYIISPPTCRGINNGKCSSCILGYGLSADATSCEVCSAQQWSTGTTSCSASASCAASTPAGYCDLCAAGSAILYGRCFACTDNTWSDGTSFGCKASSLTGCAECDHSTGLTCLHCQSGYEPSGSTCSACQSGKFSDGTQQCKDCTEISNCSPEHCGTSGCFQCDAGYGLTSAGLCEDCSSNSLWSDGTLACAACSTFDTHCSTCSATDGHCSICTAGWGVQSDGHCQECSLSNQWADGVNEKSCSACHTGCDQCNSETGACNSCHEGYGYQQADGTCKDCSADPDHNNLYSGGVKADCEPIADKTCATYSHIADACVSCQAGWGVIADSNPKNCEQCLSPQYSEGGETANCAHNDALNCYSLSQTAEQCTACVAGYAYSSGTCSECPDRRWNPDNSKGDCQQNGAQNCNDVNGYSKTEEKCLACKAGYGLNPSMGCLPCSDTLFYGDKKYSLGDNQDCQLSSHTNCLTWLHNADGCASCNPGDGLKDGTCTPCASTDYSDGTVDCATNHANYCHATSTVWNLCTSCIIGYGFALDSTTGSHPAGSCTVCQKDHYNTEGNSAPCPLNEAHNCADGGFSTTAEKCTSCKPGYGYYNGDANGGDCNQCSLAPTIGTTAFSRGGTDSCVASSFVGCATWLHTDDGCASCDNSNGYGLHDKTCVNCGASGGYSTSSTSDCTPNPWAPGGGNEGCLTPSVTSATCQTCSRGYGLTASNTCHACTTNEWSDGTVDCQPSSQNNCKEYLHTYDGCSKCNAGFELHTSDHTCHPCDINKWSPGDTTDHCTDNLASNCLVKSTESPICISCAAGSGFTTPQPQSGPACELCQGNTYSEAGSITACQPGHVTNCANCEHTQGLTCYTCLAGYEPTDTHTCTPCINGNTWSDGTHSCQLCTTITGCIDTFCDTIGQCDQCNPGWGLNAATCHSCTNGVEYSSGLEDCQQCQDLHGCAPDHCSVDGRCTKCQVGFGLKDLSCSECSAGKTYSYGATDCLACNQLPHCEVCSTNGRCTQCTAGYGLKSDGTCSACHEGQDFSLGALDCQDCTHITGCYSATSCHVNGKATRCLDGWGLSATGDCINCGNSNSWGHGQAPCQPCTDITGCAAEQCTPTGTCTSCLPGYKYENNACVSCTSNQDYSLGLTASSCTDCSQLPGCLDTAHCWFDGTCTQCKAGQGLTPQHTCHPCSDHTDFSTGLNDCTSCSQMTGCKDSANCYANGRCTQCRAGYGLQGDYTCLHCTDHTDFSTGLQGCTSCSQMTGCKDSANCYANGTCTQCQAGYGLQDDGTCQLCADGQSYSTGSTDCTACTTMVDAGCLDVNNCKAVGTCSKCKPGFGIHDGTCQPCSDGHSYSTGIPDCTPCDTMVDNGCLDVNHCQADGTCTQCKRGYGRQADGTCLPCSDGHSYSTGIPDCAPCDTMVDAGCLDSAHCFGNGNCTQCQAGYGLQADGTCLLCPQGESYSTGSTGCIPCSTMIADGCFDANSCSNKGTCSKCKPGFGIHDGTCQPCSDGQSYSTGIPDCTPCDTMVDNGCLDVSQCKAVGTCSQCKPGFGIHDGTCQPCSDTVSYSTGVPDCTPCTTMVDAGCLDVSNCKAVGSCTQCKPGYGRQANGTCLHCTDHVSYSTGIDVCTACTTMVDNGCLDVSKCEAIGQCTQCKRGYGLQADGTCLHCTDGVSYSTGTTDCNSCSQLPGCLDSAHCFANGNCTQCRTGYGLQADGTCLLCPQTESYSTGSTDCIPCSTMIAAGCLDAASCLNVGTCSKCQAGYGLDTSTGICSICTADVKWRTDGVDACLNCQDLPHCDTCGSATGLCTKCLSGNGLKNGACTPCVPLSTFSKGLLDCLDCTQIPGCLASQCDVNGACLKCAPGYSLKDGKCTQCSEGDTWSDGTFDTCKSCTAIANCLDKQCDITGKCNQCDVGYGLKSDKTCGLCIAPNEWSTGITDCNPCTAITNCRAGHCSNDGKCTECEAGWGLKDGTCLNKCLDGTSWSDGSTDCKLCTASIYHCQTCTATNGHCTLCNVGSGLDTSTGICSDCQDYSSWSLGAAPCVPCSNIPGCIDDTHCHTNGKCTKCIVTKGLDDGVCKDCTEHSTWSLGETVCNSCSLIPGCLDGTTCETNGKCTQCQVGKGLKNGVCEDCTEHSTWSKGLLDCADCATISGCLDHTTCDVDGKCTQCKIGQGLNNGVCTPCQETTTWSDGTVDCHTCHDVNGCDQCHVNGMCSLCLGGWGIDVQQGTCTQCDNHHYSPGNLVCTLCSDFSADNTYCDTCDTTTATCTGCKPGYAFEPGTTKCVACQDGYWSPGGTIPCKYCADGIGTQYCMHCDAPTGKCTSCSDGMIPDADGVCIPVPQPVCSGNTPHYCELSNTCTFDVNECMYTSVQHWCPRLEHTVYSNYECPEAIQPAPVCIDTGFKWSPKRNQCILNQETMDPLPPVWCSAQNPTWCPITSSCVSSPDACFMPQCQSKDAPYYCPMTQSCVASASVCANACTAPMVYCETKGECVAASEQCIYPICPNALHYCGSTGECLSDASACPDIAPALCGSAQRWCPSLQDCVYDPWQCPFFFATPAVDPMASHTCEDGSVLPLTSQCLPPCPDEIAPHRCTFYGDMTTTNALCVASLSDCPAPKCTGNQPYQCKDGSCAASAYYCENSVCDDGDFFCSDGTCKSSLSKCPSCPADYTDLDGTGYCAYSKSLTSCPTGKKWCITLKQCIDSTYSCPFYCPDTQYPVWCSKNNKCVESIALCLLPDAVVAKGVSTGVPDVTKTSITGVQRYLISGRKTSFLVQARISTGQNLVRSDLSVVATIVGSSISFTGVSLGTGLYIVSYSVLPPTEFTLNVTINGMQLAIYDIAVGMAPTPHVISAVLQPSGTLIYVSFDSDTNTPGTQCSDLFSTATVSTFGTGATCWWYNPRTIAISMPHPMSFSKLVLNTNQIRGCTTAAPCYTNPVNAQVGLTLTADHLTTTAILTGPSTFAICSGTTFTLSGAQSHQSTPCYGKNTGVQWQVAREDEVDVSNELLQGVASTQTLSFTTLTTVLVPDVKYIFSLTLYDCYGQSTATLAVVGTSKQSTPSISLLTKSLALKTAQSTYLQGVVSTSSCAPTSASPVNHTWMVMSKPSTGVKIASPSSLLTGVTAMTAGTHQVALIVNVLDSASHQIVSTISNIVTITVTRDSPLPVIAGGDSLTFQENITFTLDGSYSKMPDGSDVIRTWACYYPVGDGSFVPCVDRTSQLALPMGSAATQTFMGWSLLPATYKVALTVCAADQQTLCSVTSITVVIVKMSSKPSPMVSITQLNPTAQVNTYAGVSLLGAATSVFPTHAFTFSWTLTGFDLTQSSIATTRAITDGSVITIAGQVLQPGLVYTIKLTVTDTKHSVSGTSLYTFQTSTVPHGGAFTVSPTTGDALLTQFAMTLDNQWTSDHMPLTYWFTATFNNKDTFVLTGKMTAGTGSAIIGLPASITDSSAVATVRAVIVDAAQATTEVTKTVTLNRKVLSSSQLLSLLSGSMNDLSTAMSTLAAITATINSEMDVDGIADVRQAALTTTMNLAQTLVNSASIGAPEMTQLSSVIDQLASNSTQMSAASSSAAMTAVDSLLNFALTSGVTPSDAAQQSFTNAFSNLLLFGQEQQEAAPFNTTSVVAETLIAEIHSAVNLLIQASLKGQSCGSDPMTIDATGLNINALQACSDLPASGYTLTSGQLLDLSGIKTEVLTKRALNGLPDNYQLHMVSTALSFLSGNPIYSALYADVLEVRVLSEAGTIVSVTNLATPVSFQLPLVSKIPSESIPTCVWLDEDNDIWQTSGCTVIDWHSNDTHVTCQCTHLTQFSVGIFTPLRASATSDSKGWIAAAVIVPVFGAVCILAIIVVTVLLLTRSMSKKKHVESHLYSENSHELGRDSGIQLEAIAAIPSPDHRAEKKPEPAPAVAAAPVKPIVPATPVAQEEAKAASASESSASESSSKSGSASGSKTASKSGSASGSKSGSASGSASGSKSGSASGSASGSHSGSQSGSASGSGSGSASASKTGSEIEVTKEEVKH